MANCNGFLIILLLLKWIHCFEEGIEKPWHPEGDKKDRIVNGEEAPKHMYPYVALIQVFKGKKYWYTHCHGIITDPYTILTVNYCATKYLTQGMYARAVAGAHKIKDQENTKQIRAICKPEVFAPTDDPYEFKDAYALLHLSEPFVFNSFVTSINLPVPGIDVSQTNTPCWFVSWAKAADQPQDRYVQPRHKGIHWTACTSEANHNSVLCSERDLLGDDGAPVVCVTKETNYFFAKALAVRAKTSKEGVYANLATMDYGWYARSLKSAKSVCRASEHLIV